MGETTNIAIALCCVYTAVAFSAATAVALALAAWAARPQILLAVLPKEPR